MISLCYETTYWAGSSLAKEVQLREDVGVLSRLRQIDTEAKQQAW